MDVSATSRARTHLVFWNFLTWTTLICGVITQTVTFDEYNVTFTCSSNLTTRSCWNTREVPIPRQRNSFAFAVKACSDAHVILKNDTADAYLISLGNSSENTSFIRSCNPCTPFSSGRTGNSSKNFNLLACGKFKPFNVSWEKGVLKVSQPDGNETVTRLTWNDSQNQTDIDSVVLTSWSKKANDSAEWIIEDDCSKTGKPDAEEPTTVSQGHLAGAVVAALISGILLGGAGVYFGPDLWTIAKDRLPALRKRQEKDKDEEELSDLSTPDKSSTKEDATPEDKSEAELPGRRRAPPNAYTSCTVTKAPQPPRPTPTRPVTGKAADVKQTIDVKSNLDVKPGDDVGRAAASGRKSKKTEGVTSPRDSKPADDVRRVAAKGGKSKNPLAARASGKAKKGSAKVEEEEPAEIYANEETNVYEGMKPDAPIYENRNTGVYESLNAGK